MNDIYLGQRESNRGCLVISIAALMILFLAWFVFFRDAGNNPPPDNRQSQVADPSIDGDGNPIPPEAQITEALGSGENRTTRPASNDQTGSNGGGVSDPTVKGFVAQAQASLERGEYDRARSMGFKAMDAAGNARDRDQAARVLSQVHDKMLGAGTNMPELKSYKVQYGDALSKIARKFGTTVGVIKKVNNLKDDRINFGQNLLILQGKWSVVVDLSDKTCDLQLNDKFFKRYKAGVGRPDSPTPEGTFKIVEKLKNPAWFPAGGGKIESGDPENELGSRWLGWSKDSFGLHGTNDPKSIGKESSSGCVRLTNQDVEDIYEFLPYQATITVKP